MRDIFYTYILPLLLTYIIEGVFFLALFGKIDRKSVLWFFAANTATNVPLNIAVNLFSQATPLLRLAILVILEAAAVVIEWGIYKYLAKNDEKKLFYYVFLANFLSFSLGNLIYVAINYLGI